MKKLCIFDTSFHEEGRYSPLTFISVSLVLYEEDSREPKELHLVNKYFDEDRAGGWIEQYVLPYLPPPNQRVSPSEASEMMKSFLGIDRVLSGEDTLELASDNVSYNHLVFSQLLFGDLGEYPTEVLDMYPLHISSFSSTFRTPDLYQMDEWQSFEMKDTSFYSVRMAANKLVFTYKFIESNFPQIYSMLKEDRMIPLISGYENYDNNAVESESPNERVMPYPNNNMHNSDSSTMINIDSIVSPY